VPTAPAIRGWISGTDYANGFVSLSATTGWNTAAPAAGDVLIAFTTAQTVSGPSTSASSLFTEVVQLDLPGWGANIQAWKRAFNATDTTYRFDNSQGISNGTTVLLVALSGADTSTIAESGSNGTGYDFGSTANPMIAPSVSGLSTAADYLLTGFATESNTTARTFTTPSGTTSIGSQQNTVPAGKQSLAVFGLALASSSPTATQSSTVSSAYNAGGVISVAVQPVPDAASKVNAPNISPSTAVHRSTRW